MSTGFDRLAEKRDLVLKAMLAAGYARQQLHDCLGEQAFPEDVYTKLRDDSDKMWSYDLKFDGRTLDQWTRSKPSKASPQRRGLFALGGALLGLAGAGVGGAVYNKFKKKEAPHAEAIKVPDANGEDAGGSLQVADIETLNTATSTLIEYNTFNSTFVNQQVTQLQTELEAARRELEEQRQVQLLNANEQEAALIANLTRKDVQNQQLITELQARVTATEAQVQHHQRDMQAANERTTAAEVRVAAAEASVARIPTLEQELASARASHEGLQAELATLKVSESTANGEIRSLKLQLDTAKEQARRAEEQLGMIQSQLTELQRETGQLKVSAAAGAVIHAGATDREQTAIARAARAEEHLNECNQRLSELRTANHELDLKLVGQSSTLLSLGQDNKRVTADLAIARTRIELVDAQVTELRQANVKLSGELSSMQQSNLQLMAAQDLESQRSAQDLLLATNRAERAETELGLLRSANSELASTKAELASRLALALQADQSTAARSAVLSKELIAVTARAAAAEEKSHQLELESSQMKVYIQNARLEFTSRDAVLHQRNVEVISLRERNDTLQDELHKAELSIGSITPERDRLKADLDAIRGQIAAYETAAGQRVTAADARAKASDDRAAACEAQKIELMEQKLKADAELRTANGELAAAQKQNAQHVEAIRIKDEKIDRFVAEIRHVQPLCFRLSVYANAQQSEPQDQIRAHFAILAGHTSGNNTQKPGVVSDELKSCKNTEQILDHLISAEAMYKLEYRRLHAQLQTIIETLHSTLATIEISTVEPETGVSQKQELTAFEVRGEVAAWVNFKLSDFKQKLADRETSLTVRHLIVQNKLERADAELKNLRAERAALTDQNSKLNAENFELGKQNTEFKINTERHVSERKILQADLKRETERLTDQSQINLNLKREHASAISELTVKLSAQDALLRERPPQQVHHYSGQPADLRNLTAAVSEIIQLHRRIIRAEQEQGLFLLSITASDESRADWSDGGGTGKWFATAYMNMNDREWLLQQDAINDDLIADVLKGELDTLRTFFGIFDGINKAVNSVINKCMETTSPNGRLAESEEKVLNLEARIEELMGLGNAVQSEYERERMSNILSQAQITANEELRSSYEQQLQRQEGLRQNIEAQYQTAFIGMQQSYQSLSSQCQTEMEDLKRQLSDVKLKPAQLVDQAIGQFFTTVSGLTNLGNNDRPNSMADQALYEVITRGSTEMYDATVKASSKEILDAVVTYFTNSAVGKDYDLTLSRLLDAYKHAFENVESFTSLDIVFDDTSGAYVWRSPQSVEMKRIYN